VEERDREGEERNDREEGQVREGVGAEQQLVADEPLGDGDGEL
jgi:hypothetical protein